MAAWPAGLTGPGGSRLALTGVIACRQPGDAEAGLYERVQPLGGDRRTHPGQRPPYQPQVQRADDVLVMLGHLAEGALVQA